MCAKVPITELWLFFKSWTKRLAGTLAAASRIRSFAHLL